MKRRSLYVLVTILLMTIAVPAQAQLQFTKDNLLKAIRKVGVHGNVSVRKPVDSDVTKGLSFGGSLGLSPGRTNGWKFPVGFTMYSETLHSPNGEEFALFRARAIMAGVGYGWHFGRFSTGVGIQTGYSFNRGRTQGDMLPAFGVPNEAFALHVSNSVLLRPQLNAEYFITPKFTLRASADYMMTRPDITVTTPTARFEDRWDASSVHANFGVGFYPFRK